ncbi:DUF4937 domain-containing protein [Kitasatospora sp. NPDC093558]|uniref:DUF4937 domain-containing protein n=1 Tax=Kitasatospora sp. NPDC093558 TaxID=3155201 RepID=UPI00341794F5
MWVKWINCRVLLGGQDAFADAQREWAAIADQPGLVGQVGGWEPDGGRAHVLGLWADHAAYTRFMEERHDEIVKEESYKRFRRRDDHDEPAPTRSWLVTAVATGPSVLDIPGEAGLREALPHATLLRVADCHLHPGRAEHFLDAQLRIWNPAMAAADGMLAGTVTRLADDRYLVTTLWTDADAHQRYADRDVTALRARADVVADVHTLAGLALPLEPEWQVLPDVQ